MGAQCSNIDSANIHAMIEQQLREDSTRLNNVVKLLLLGAGEAGKSTLVKQMKILHLNGFSEEELQVQTKFVFADTLEAILSLLNAMEILHIHFDGLEREADANIVRQFAVETAGFTLEEGKSKRFTAVVTDAIKRLWADAGVKTCHSRSNEFQLTDSAAYFLDKIDQMSSPRYTASVDDMLRVRVRTTGVVEIQFILKGLQFRVIDVGGQRSERKKWLRCFDGVDVIIFVAAISEYDQLLFEDNKTNRMHESIGLFHTICAAQFFTKTNFILFLNKIDLFKEKLQRSPLTIAFPEYSGSKEYETAVDFIRTKFLGSLQTSLQKIIYPFLTCATDTNQIDNVFASCVDTIVSKNMKKMGMF